MASVYLRLDSSFSIVMVSRVFVNSHFWICLSISDIGFLVSAGTVIAQTTVCHTDDDTIFLSIAVVFLSKTGAGIILFH